MSGQPRYKWNDHKGCWVNGYGTPIIWTDGSCPDNHRGPNRGTSSGIGVYVHERKKWSEFNDKYNHTNNWSELYAIEFALGEPRESIGGRRFEIRTDSQYSIDCITKWSDKWIANGWKTTNGEDVEHKKVIQEILTIINQNKLKVWFVKIPREGELFY